MGATEAEREDLTKHFNSMSMADRAAVIDRMYEHPDPNNFSHPVAKRWAANYAAELEDLENVDNRLPKKASLASVGVSALGGAAIGGIAGGATTEEGEDIKSNALAGAAIGALAGGGLNHVYNASSAANMSKVIKEPTGLPVPHINTEASRSRVDQVWDMHRRNLREIEERHGISAKESIQNIMDNHEKHKAIMRDIDRMQGETSKALADMNKELDSLTSSIPDFHRDTLSKALKGGRAAKGVVGDIPTYMKEHGLEMSHFSPEDQRLIRKHTITKLSSENVGLGALCGGLGLMSTLGKEASHPYMHDENEFVAEKGPYKHQTVPLKGIKGLAEGAGLGGVLGMALGSIGGTRTAFPGALVGMAAGGLVNSANSMRTAYKQNKAFMGNPAAYETHLRDRFRKHQLPMLEDDEATFMDAVSLNPMSGGSRLSSLSPEHARINQANIAERDKIRQMSSAAYQNYLNKLRADYQNLNRKEREMAYEEVVYNGMPYSKEAGLKFPARLMSAEALGSAAVGAVGGYLTAEPGDKLRSVAMGAVAGAGMGAAFRPHIRAGMNQIKALDSQKLTQTPGPKVDMPSDFLKKNPGGAPPKPQKPDPILKPSTSRYSNGTVRPKGF